MGLLDWFRGKGPSGFGYCSTAEQVTAGVDASGLTALVTGATSGIGKETARVLALRGAKVILSARSIDGGLKAKQEILDGNPQADLDVMELDLASLESVRSFADRFNKSVDRLNILVNNAGVFVPPFSLSKDGVELQFATNHLGPFLLTILLLDKMKATAKKTGVQGRIVNVSSYLHTQADSGWFDLELINDESKYSRFLAYSRSKMANIWHANELASRLKEEDANVTANSLHPGVILTNLGRHIKLVLNLSAPLLRPFVKNIPQGAATTCYLALNPNLKDVSGKYFADCNEAKPIPTATSVELAKSCWDFSNELIETVTGKEVGKEAPA